MPYLYRCRQCRAESPVEHPDRADAEAEQEHHRDTIHGGLAPLGGDGVHRVHAQARGARILPRHSFAAALVMLALILANCWGR
ncbi:hypothetical protein [Streptomyces coerulescens]|uniref:Regulatory protein FmdB Zinc ribbon domain-containing protein n=1 Tax=Streptomyces coerulescens TaxID=29304 RepID=A0ABW0CN62_STRCD